MTHYDTLANDTWRDAAPQLPQPDPSSHTPLLPQPASSRSVLSGATITSCVINLANTTLGSGMLALPAAIASVGVFLGSFLLCLAAVGSGLGLYLLSRCAAYTSPYSKDASFFACARATYPKAALYINAAIAVKCFGVGVSYLIIVGDLIPEILAGLGYQVQGLLADRRLWITVSMAVVVPLSFLRTLNALRYTSVAALSAVVYLVMLVVWSFLDTSRPKPSDVEWGIVNGGKGVFYNLPIFVFAFTCHQNMFSVYNELGNRTIGRLNAVIGQSVAIALGVYQTVGILGYLSFGSKVLPNLILMYESGTVVLVGRVLLVLLQVFSYPLQCHPCRTCLDQILPRQLPEYKRQRRSSDASLSTTSSADPMDDVSPQPTSHDVRFFWLTTGILLGSYLLAISVSQLDVVLAFVGATGSTAISFVLPGLFYWSMHRTAPMDLTKLASGVLMVVGMVVMVVCLTANVIKVTRAGEP